MNILDYGKWRGDLSFDVEPFNYVDSLCFAQISYCKFDGLLKDEKVTIEKLATAYFEKDKDLDQLNLLNCTSKADQVLKMMSNCIRYKNLKVYNYESYFNKENTEQFAALMVDLPKETLLIYRGTDDSLVGWHEDLKMSYMPIMAQDRALAYFNRHFKLFHRYLLLGHSKGGNLALYAATNCKDFYKRAIKEVISLDGPNLNPKFYKESAYLKIKAKYLQILPSFSVFGRIYENDNRKLIIKSDGNNLSQHRLLTWQIEGKEILKAEKFEEMSDEIKNVLEEFLLKTTNLQRSIFIDELFESLEKANIHYMSEFSQNSLSIMIKILNNLSKIDNEAKQVAYKLLKGFMNLGGKQIKKYLGIVAK